MLDCSRHWGLGPQALVYASRLFCCFIRLLLYSCALRLHSPYTPLYVGVCHSCLYLCMPLCCGVYSCIIWLSVSVYTLPNWSILKLSVLCTVRPLLWCIPLSLVFMNISADSWHTLYVYSCIVWCLVTVMHHVTLYSCSLVLYSLSPCRPVTIAIVLLCDLIVTLCGYGYTPGSGWAFSWKPSSPLGKAGCSARTTVGLGASPLALRCWIYCRLLCYCCCLCCARLDLYILLVWLCA